jgi:DNA-binding NtrC family response regulator
MEKKAILIVDDEKNIRLTLSQAIQSSEIDTETAVNAEEALEKLKEKSFSLMLLDLRLPGMSGMELLREVTNVRPDIKVIIITAYGTIESAVEAMKHGAVDYIQKPFSPDEIRELVSKVLHRDELVEEEATDYDSKLELAKKNIQEQHFEAAIEHAKNAIALDSSRPEAHNLLGVLLEIQGKADDARREYRLAISVDPSYEPARKNLHRLTGWEPDEKIHIGEDDKSVEAETE